MPNSSLDRMLHPKEDSAPKLLAEFRKFVNIANIRFEHLKDVVLSKSDYRPDFSYTTKIL